MKTTASSKFVTLNGIDWPLVETHQLEGQHCIVETLRVMAEM